MSRRLITGRGLMGPGADQGADTVLVEGGRIVAVGRRSEFEGVEAERSTVDGWLAPRLVDAHLHPGGLVRRGVELGGVSNRRELAELLAGEAARLPRGVAVIGHGLDDEPLGGLPTRDELDQAVADRPVLVYRRCGHVASANTAALELSGVTPDVADPPGGSFDRDPSGRPTGVLREAAVGLVGAALAPLAPGPKPDQVYRALAELAGQGVGRVGAMVTVGDGVWCGIGNELELPVEAAPLPLEVEVFVITSDTEALKRAARRVETTPGLRFGGWKGFADGSLGGWTAALRSPYHDRPDTTGILRLDPDRAADLSRLAVELGGVPAIHAIGDAAVEAVIDLYRDLRAVGVQGAFRIEHASVMDHRLIDRAVELGVVLSVQPAFALSDSSFLERRLGPERDEWAYPLRRMIDQGATLVTGSDAPVEPPDVWRTLRAAVERCGLSLAEAIAITAARPLQPGAPADLVVVTEGPAPGGSAVG